jgi:aconitate hydratase
MEAVMLDSFGCKQTLEVNGKKYSFYNINALPEKFNVSRLPFSIKILLENLLRHEDGENVTRNDIEAILNWDPKKEPAHEIAFMPARVILQDFTGVPAMVDLAAMREAMQTLGGDPKKINPLSQVDLVIDHSVQVDVFGTPDSYQRNTAIEQERNKERYSFLRWGQESLANFRVVPPGTGIVHQVNLEYLAKVVFLREANNEAFVYPDTLVGTDSHTTMINGLGVLAWGVGGIEAEAAMLGQPISMFIPQVIGFELTGKLSEIATATDLVLTVTEMLRKKGVVNKFVEFFGDGLEHLSLADRATIGNMAPEYGATCGLFPIDQETINYLKLTGRDNSLVDLVAAYTKQQGMFRNAGAKAAEYSDVLSLDLSTVEPCIAGPKRPQDRIQISKAKDVFNAILNEQGKSIDQEIEFELDKQKIKLSNSSVVIAAITSCTNTSNPDVMVAAGLIAKKAHELGITSKPWVKTSLAPGSKVVTDYLNKAGLTRFLEECGFYLVGYGCTTCIGNSGPLHEQISAAIKENKLAVSAVLSGNRNFEGRIHPDVQYSFLCSPPLVVLYALAGTMNINLLQDPIAIGKNGKEIYLKDLWPSKAEIQNVVQQCVQTSMFNAKYQDVFSGNAEWRAMDVRKSDLYPWDPESTYVKNPPYFTDIKIQPAPLQSLHNARVLVMIGDSVTTDHISPAGAISMNTPAAKYLQAKGVQPKDFNSYGSRRGNHEVMMRAAFANIRLKNLLAPGTTGDFTTYFPSNVVMPIFDAAMQYKKDGCKLIVLAGKEYGSGSSRDWAAKGPKLLGIEVVIAESFERIHRSNLIGMGILPLQFKPGQNAKSLNLTGKEQYSIDIANLKANQRSINVTVVDENNNTRSFEADVCIYTPKEYEYYRNDGILQYVLRRLAV